MSDVLLTNRYYNKLIVNRLKAESIYSNSISNNESYLYSIIFNDADFVKITDNSNIDATLSFNIKNINNIIEFSDRPFRQTNNNFPISIFIEFFTLKSQNSFNNDPPNIVLIIDNIQKTYTMSLANQNDKNIVFNLKLLDGENHTQETINTNMIMFVDNNNNNDKWQKVVKQENYFYTIFKLKKYNLPIKYYIIYFNGIYGGGYFLSTDSFFENLNAEKYQISNKGRNGLPLTSKYIGQCYFSIIKNKNIKELPPLYRTGQTIIDTNKIYYKNDTLIYSNTEPWVICTTDNYVKLTHTTSNNYKSSFYKTNNNTSIYYKSPTGEYVLLESFYVVNPIDDNVDPSFYGEINGQVEYLNNYTELYENNSGTQIGNLVSYLIVNFI